VGAPVGAAAGLVGGLTGANEPRFHHYVIEERIPSYEWREHPRVVVGDVLPSEGITLYPLLNTVLRTTNTQSLTTSLSWSIPRLGGS
jgi:hypothetical protein